MEAPPAPRVCVTLMTSLIECAIQVAGDSCDEMAHLYQGYNSNPEGVGPPSDPTMPCYSELMATWDAGCEPYLY